MKHFWIPASLALLLLSPARAELVRAGNGSGFFITTDGYFVTNYHVVDGASAVAIKVDDGLVQAKVVKTDATNDIAVLKVEGKYPCLPLGEDLQTRPGEEVFTIGFPMTDVMGEAPKTTLGTVSALTGINDDARAFQISVQIQPGNSGGPLVLKSTGNVIGVTSASLNGAKFLQQGRALPQNVNYAMKASYIRPLLASIPGLAEKLPAIHNGERPWREIQQDVEKCAGLVVVFAEARQEPEQAPTPPMREGEPQPGPGSGSEPKEEPRPQTPPENAQPRIWVFADSSSRTLSKADLASLDVDLLWRARNEIYARNGLIFSSARGKALTAALGSAYHGVDSDQDRVFTRMNKVEQANVTLIQSMEKQRR